MFASIYSSRFKAANSWDYILLEPRILDWLTKHKYCEIVSDKIIEDDLKAEGLPPRINDVRLRHCISRTLEVTGYIKRSKRGHAWDYGGLAVNDRHESLISRISRRFKKNILEPTIQVPLTNFFVL